MTPAKVCAGLTIFSQAMRSFVGAAPTNNDARESLRRAYHLFSGHVIFCGSRANE